MLAGEFRPRPRGASSERGMPARSRVLTKDEELGKRDDDFRPANTRTSALSALLPWHWRKRRLLLVIIIVGIVYVFMRDIPTSASLNENGSFGLGWQGQQNTFSSHPGASRSHVEPKGAPPREISIEDDERSKHYYDGPIKFFRLGDTLRKMPNVLDTMAVTRNVLFAASSLKSLANLLPLACEMARQNQAYAHVVLFGRSTISIKELLEINGVDKTTCTAYFHDARGDFAEFSSDSRAELSVAGAMVHIQNYMRPQALIVDDGSLEDRFFLDAMTVKAKEMDRPLIEIPKGRYEDYLWITRLDAGSLSGWYTPTVDIVVQAPPGSSGSLIRLLKSLRSADYGAIKVPRLTVELPATPEAFVVGFLARFKWPPYQDKSLKPSNFLTVRHRIPSSKTTAEQASLRFLESFFPTDPNNHHTLILSPQAQVSPQFMHLLHYLILKYRHSSYGSPGSVDILGLALETRDSTLNGTAFNRPALADLTSWKYRHDQSSNKDTPTAFLYQAPSSGAALIFGDKWVALHSFLANRLASTHLGKAAQVKKLVSETEPAWMEYLLELMRARGWSMIYPALSFVTMHNEMAQIPEEFIRPSSDSPLKDTDKLDASSRAREEAFLVADVPPTLEEHIEYDLSKNFGPLHKVLPLKGVLPDIYEMPSYSYEGDPLSNLDLNTRASEFTTYFRTAIGGCQSKEAELYRQIDWMDTKDLFCLPGMEVETADEIDGSDDFETNEYSIHSATSMDEDSAEVDLDIISSKADPDVVTVANINTQDETEADVAHDST